jgi:hypothetical protein
MQTRGPEFGCLHYCTTPSNWCRVLIHARKKRLKSEGKLRASNYDKEINTELEKGRNEGIEEFGDKAGGEEETL